jgi:hypothetical protein
MAENKGRTLAMLPRGRNHCAKIVVAHIAPHDASRFNTHERLMVTSQPGAYADTRGKTAKIAVSQPFAYFTKLNVVNKRELHKSTPQPLDVRFRLLPTTYSYEPPGSVKGYVSFMHARQLLWPDGLK